MRGFCIALTIAGMISLPVLGRAIYMTSPDYWGTGLELSLSVVIGEAVLAITALELKGVS